MVMGRFAGSTVVSRWARYNEGTLKGKNAHEAHNHGSLSFVGEWLYSYRTVVAAYHKKGDRLHVLVTTHKYGVTTAKHINWARRYASNIHDVPNVKLEGESAYMQNQQYLLGTFKDLKAAIVRDFKNKIFRYTPWRDALRDHYHNITRYAEFAGWEHGIDIDAEIAEVARLRDEKMDKFFDPKAVERRERARARKEAKIALGLA